MRTTRSSKTAAQMALSRALETRRAVAERICSDKYAERFLDGVPRWLVSARPLRAATEALIERLFAGHHGYVLVRTAYFDAVLGEELDRGLAQVVVLGAGFDSRAQRFADRLREVAVFEVDHPATSATKQAVIGRVLGQTANGVRYVPVDFQSDDLAASLDRHGFRRDCRTLFLWEGTTPYVAAAGVDATLHFVARSSAAGSVVVFDYILASVLDGTCTMRGALTERDKMRQTDEPFVFGIADDAIARFLAARGFALVHDAGAEELRERFVPPHRHGLYVKPWWRIARATVDVDRPHRGA